MACDSGMKLLLKNIFFSQLLQRSDNDASCLSTCQRTLEAALSSSGGTSHRTSDVRRHFFVATELKKPLAEHSLLFDPCVA